MTPDDAMTELVAQAQEMGMYTDPKTPANPQNPPMITKQISGSSLTIQQITDRLAEEAGWVYQPNDGNPYWERGFYTCGHPFPPDSIDAAVRAVPEGLTWLVSSNRATVWVPGRSFVSGNTFTHTDGKTPAENLYFASAKARGWM